MEKQEKRVSYKLLKKKDYKSCSFLYKSIYDRFNLSISDYSFFCFNRLNIIKTRVDFFLYIQSSKRSTRISLINKKGLVLLTFSVGFLNYKKSNRKGSFSAIRLFHFFFKEFHKLKLPANAKIVICLKGFGPGRRPLSNLLGKGLLKNKCVYLVDLTPLAFNGCRLKKRRRL
jgi:ribosomal protein S11